MGSQAVTMKLSKHFTLEEMTISQTATRLGIDNNPNSEEMANLKGLANFLEVVREKVKRPIIISSGYRSEALNKAIGGAKHSAHINGRAADITAPSFGTPRELAELIAALDLEFDKVILEFDRWVHVQVSDRPRHRVLTASSGPSGVVYTAGLV